MNQYKFGLGVEFLPRVLWLLIVIIGFGCVTANPGFAQVRIANPPPPPPYSVVPVPSQIELSKLVWSIMVEVHHSNISGNYSVLRDLSAPAFQMQNNPARLTDIFSSLRKQNIDLSNVLLVAPSFTAPPRMVQPDVMRTVGFFGLRPKAIYFDLHFQWIQGRWRLYGISINPVSLPTKQSGRAGK